MGWAGAETLPPRFVLRPAALDRRDRQGGGVGLDAKGIVREDADGLQRAVLKGAIGGAANGELAGGKGAVGGQFPADRGCIVTANSGKLVGLKADDDFVTYGDNFEKMDGVHNIAPS